MIRFLGILMILFAIKAFVFKTQDNLAQSPDLRWSQTQPFLDSSSSLQGPNSSNSRMLETFALESLPNAGVSKVRNLAGKTYLVENCIKLNIQNSGEDGTNGASLVATVMYDNSVKKKTTLEGAISQFFDRHAVAPTWKATCFEKIQPLIEEIRDKQGSRSVGIKLKRETQTANTRKLMREEKGGKESEIISEQSLEHRI